MSNVIELWTTDQREVVSRLNSLGHKRLAEYIGDLTREEWKNVSDDIRGAVKKRESHITDIATKIAGFTAGLVKEEGFTDCAAALLATAEMWEAQLLKDIGSEITVSGNLKETLMSSMRFEEALGCIREKELDASL